MTVPVVNAAAGRVRIFSSKVEKPALAPSVTTKPLHTISQKPTLRSENSFTNAEAASLEDPFAELSKESNDTEARSVDLMMIDLVDEPLEDIDANDRDDPQCCTEYVNEIFEYCHLKEVCPSLVSSSYHLHSSITLHLFTWGVGRWVWAA